MRHFLPFGHSPKLHSLGTPGMMARYGGNMKIDGLAAAFMLGLCIGIGKTWAWMVFEPNAYVSFSYVGA